MVFRLHARQLVAGFPKNGECIPGTEGIGKFQAFLPYSPKIWPKIASLWDPFLGSAPPQKGTSLQAPAPPGGAQSRLDIFCQFATPAVLGHPGKKL